MKQSCQGDSLAAANSAAALGTSTAAAPAKGQGSEVRGGFGPQISQLPLNPKP